MRSIQIYTTTDVTLDTFAARLQDRFDVVRQNGDSLLVQWRPPAEQDSHLWFWLEDRASEAADFTFDQLARMPPEPWTLFQVPFRGLELLKDVLVVVADDDRVWVNLDEAAGDPIYRGALLAARMRRDPTWNLGL